MEDRYVIVDIYLRDSEYAELEKSQAVIDLYRVESFCPVKEGGALVKMYSGDGYHVAATFQEFYDLWFPYAGGKMQMFA